MTKRKIKWKLAKINTHVTCRKGVSEAQRHTLLILREKRPLEGRIHVHHAGVYTALRSQLQKCDLVCLSLVHEKEIVTRSVYKRYFTHSQPAINLTAFRKRPVVI